MVRSLNMVRPANGIQFRIYPGIDPAMMAAMTITDSRIEARQQALAEFLRSRRERLTPADVGLLPGTRRRTPGLRREEVAMLAGVGTTWYTWLEQGRGVRPSPEALSGLASALRLDLSERRHLFILSGRPPPETESPPTAEVHEGVRRMLASMAAQPAYVTGWRWDLLAWNVASAAVFGDYSCLEGDQRNIMSMVFANPAHRAMLTDWEPLARSTLATFRADTARYAGHPDLERLIATLNDKSPEFRAWWPRHEVLAPMAGNKRIDHPAMGRMIFEHMSLAVDGGSGLRLVVFTPLAADGTIDKLHRLLGGLSAKSAAV
jgi:transcriptional regulator with XRE-family HTH domain